MELELLFGEADPPPPPFPPPFPPPPPAALVGWL